MSSKRSRSGDAHAPQGNEDERKAQLEAHRNLSNELQQFKSGRGLDAFQVARVDELVNALQQQTQKRLLGAMSNCFDTFTDSDFEGNAHRTAILGLLFKIPSAVHPPCDEHRRELLAQLNLHIERDVAVRELLALNAAVCRNDEAGALVAFNNCFAVVIDKGSDDLFDLILGTRNTLQPPQPEFAECVKPLYMLMRESKEYKEVLAELRAVDDNIRLERNERNKKHLITAIHRALDALPTEGGVPDTLLRIRLQAQAQESRACVISLYRQLRKVDQRLGRNLREVDVNLGLDDTESVASCVETCVNTLVNPKARLSVGLRDDLLRMAFDIDMAIRPVPSEFATVKTRLCAEFNGSASASALWKLRESLRDDGDDLTAAAQQYEAAYGEKTSLVTDMRTYLAPDFLKPLREALAATDHAFNLAENYSSKLNVPPTNFKRQVLFLNVGDRDSVDRRAVAVDFVPRLAHWTKNWAGRDWQKLLAVTGPSGCGKTIMGLFGLAEAQEVLVYIGTPPALLDNLTAPPDAKTALSAAVQKLVDDAKKSQPASGAAPNEEHRKHLKNAVGEYLLEQLQGLVGRRLEGPPVDVIFFFDEVGAADENANYVRIGVQELSKTLCADSASKNGQSFGGRLETELGLKVRGFAMGGTGLDAERAVGSLADPTLCDTVSPECKDLKWSDLSSRVDLETECRSAGGKAELDAALKLPRLAALVVQRALKNVESSAPMQLLADSVRLAINDFAGLNSLKELMPPSARNRRAKVAHRCLQLLVDPPPVQKVSELSGLSRDVISRFGLVSMVLEKGKVCFVVGPGERLVLSHLFGLENAEAGFERSIADFLCLAAVVSRGKTLSHFLGALNRFFAHEAQHPDDFRRIDDPQNRPATPTVQAPAGMGDHVLAADSAAIVELLFKIEKTAPSEEAKKFLSEFRVATDVTSVLINGEKAASWDLQLVLRVADPNNKSNEDATKFQFVTFDIQVKRYIAESFSRKDFETEAEKVVGVPRTWLPDNVKSHDGGFVAVVGRLLKQATWTAGGAAVWHANLTQPTALGIVPCRVWTTSEEKELSVVRRTVASVLEAADSDSVSASRHPQVHAGGRNA